LKQYAVDTSVSVKWFLPEIHSRDALRLLNKEFELLAPDLIFTEFGNVLWKKWRADEIDSDSAKKMLSDFKRMPLAVISSEIILDFAWTIAKRYQRSFYDSLYLAVAETQECRLVTADKKFYNALKSTPLGKSLLWIEDLK
jgi:predicted nucleic acid-binding protein